MRSFNSHDKHWGKKRLDGDVRGIDRHLSFNRTNKNSSVAIMQLAGAAGMGEFTRYNTREDRAPRGGLCLMVVWERRLNGLKVAAETQRWKNETSISLLSNLLCAFMPGSDYKIFFLVLNHGQNVRLNNHSGINCHFSVRRLETSIVTDHNPAWVHWGGMTRSCQSCEGGSLM